MLSAPLRAFSAAVVGAVVGSALAAYLWLGHAGLVLWDVKLLLTAAVPLAVTPAIAFGALLMPLLGRPRRGSAFLSAALLPLGGLAGAWLVHRFGLPHLAIPGCAVLAALVGMVQRLPALPGLILHPVAFAALALVGLLYSGFGKPERQVLEPYDLADAPELPAAGAAAGTGLDILLISVDTLRADSALREDVPTPVLDDLRARGRWADYALAPAPSTLPSHVTMLTGEGTMRHGSYSNLGLLETDESLRSLAEVLGESGYRTVATAANELLVEKTGFASGFEVLVNLQAPRPEDAFARSLVLSARNETLAVVLPDRLGAKLAMMLAGRRLNLPSSEALDGRGFNAERVRDTALHYLDRLYAQDAPFFYFLHFMDPHLPYAAPQEYRGRLSDVKDLPERYRDYPFLSTMCAQQVQTELREGRPEALEALAHLQDVYHEELMLVDTCLGAVLERVEASGRPTVVLFTSDHGEHFGEHGLMMHGNSVYEELLRVPFILVAPGVEAGRFEVVPRLRDVPLTLLRAAGFPAERFGEGRDLLADPEVLAAAAEEGTYGTGERELAVYREGFKLLLYWNSADPQRGGLEAFGLYDLEADPGERDNLLRDPAHAAMRQALEIMADNLRADAMHRKLRPFDAADLHNLAALGYAFNEEGERDDP